MKSPLLISSSILVAGGGITYSIGTTGRGGGDILGLIMLTLGGIIFTITLVTLNDDDEGEDQDP